MTPAEPEPAEVFCTRADLADLPAGPGCYLFYNRRGELLYVGQSATLRARVRSYFQPSAELSRRRRGMVRAVRRIGVLTVDCDLAARLLEARLIKRRRPRYNLWLRTHRPYWFLRLDPADPFARLTITAAPAADGARYYGPLRGKATAELAVDAVRAAARLRTCDGRLRPRADHPGCWEGDIGRCPRPCDGTCPPNAYAAQVATALTLIEGHPNGLLAALAGERDRLAEALRFEEAADTERRRAEIERILARRDCVSRAIDEHDVLVVRRGEVVAVARGRYAGWLKLRADLDADDLANRIAEWSAERPRDRARLTGDEVEELRLVAVWLAEQKSARFVYAAGRAPDELAAAVIVESAAPGAEPGAADSSGREG